MKQRKAMLALALYLVLGCWKGYVALFDQGQQEPRQIFPTQVSALPMADQTALNAGILIRNQRELERLLEDFLS